MSKGMQIAKPGTLKGTAVIDVAEIDGDFTGKLTAHAKLVVNGTGRVSGTIRYGSLIVAEGGEVTDDVKRLDDDPAPTPRQAVDPRATVPNAAHCPYAGLRRSPAPPPGGRHACTARPVSLGPRHAGF